MGRRTKEYRDRNRDETTKTAAHLKTNVDGISGKSKSFKNYDLIQQLNVTTICPSNNSRSNWCMWIVDEQLCMVWTRLHAVDNIMYPNTSIYIAQISCQHIFVLSVHTFIALLFYPGLSARVCIRSDASCRLMTKKVYSSHSVWSMVAYTHYTYTIHYIMYIIYDYKYSFYIIY